MITGSRVLGIVAVLAAAQPSALLGQSLRPHDSAGTRTAESSRASWSAAAQIHIDAKPTMVFGGPGAPRNQVFGEIKGVAKLGDGTIVIADADKGRISYFAPTGNARLVLNASSTQYTSIWSFLHWGSDTVAAWDGMVNRLVGFNRTGRLIRWDHIDQPPDAKLDQGYSRMALILTGRFNSGELLGRVQSLHGMPAQGIEAESVTVDRISAKGKLAPIARVLRLERFRFDGANHGVADDLPFGRRGSIAVGTTDWFYTDGSDFEIERRSPSGATISRIRRDRTRRPVTSASIKLFAASRLPRIDSLRRQAYSQALAWLTYPKLEPAYTALVVDAHERLWARTWAMDGAPAWWDVFSAEGQYLGAVEVPPDLVVLEIGKDYLLARYTGQPGVEEVRVYRLSGGT